MNCTCTTKFLLHKVTPQYPDIDIGGTVVQVTFHFYINFHRMLTKIVTHIGTFFLKIKHNMVWYCLDFPYHYYLIWGRE